MSSDLKKFLQSVAEGLDESPWHDAFVGIEEVIDGSLSDKIKEVMSELSGNIVAALADELEKRGRNLDGRKTVKGFSDHDHSQGGV